MIDTDPYIAVVDDESSIRTMLGRVLRLAHYRVNAYSCGEDFLASLATQRPKCVILDIHMPGLSGFQVQTHMRASNIQIPVVLITASDDIAFGLMALEANATCLLRKPFSTDELLRAIDVALRSSGRAP